MCHTWPSKRISGSPSSLLRWPNADFSTDRARLANCGAPHSRVRSRGAPWTGTDGWLGRKRLGGDRTPLSLSPAAARLGEVWHVAAQRAAAR